MANMKYLLTYGNFIFLALLFSFIDNFGMDKKSVENNSDYSFKVVFLGDAAVGKTQIINKFVNDKFDASYQLTIGIEFATKVVDFENKKIELQLWDTAGQENYRSITKKYYNTSRLIAFVYDITSKDSFNNISKWVDEVKIQNKDAKFLLVGNKYDLAEERRTVTEEEAKQYAENNGMKFFEVSAKTGDGINDMFNYIISELLKEKEPGLFDNQYKNDIKFNKTSCLNEYCSCCPCLEKTKGNVKEQEEIEQVNKPKMIKKPIKKK